MRASGVLPQLLHCLSECCSLGSYVVGMALLLSISIAAVLSSGLYQGCERLVCIESGPLVHEN